ncbi:hypothetical protein PG994_008850 [Apiospora phragmitis]|uniref:Zn(2)-C6 fungal-type domain-containing protein n=1 Tax=Apiospora phragmitis TaxID=2905665 RepID=A0ABR1UI60_9PEZI
MNHENSLDVQELPACYRCHASKVRCRRAPGQVQCRRCTRAAYSDCHPRPSRHGRVGQQQTRRPSGTSTIQKEDEEDHQAAGSSSMPVEPSHELHEQKHASDVDQSHHAILGLIAASVAPSGDNLSDLFWSPFGTDFDPDLLHAPLPPTPSQPSASSRD